MSSVQVRAKRRETGFTLLRIRHCSEKGVQLFIGLGSGLLARAIVEVVVWGAVSLVVGVGTRDAVFLKDLFNKGVPAFLLDRRERSKGCSVCGCKAPLLTVSSRLE